MIHFRKINIEIYFSGRVRAQSFVLTCKVLEVRVEPTVSGTSRMKQGGWSVGSRWPMPCGKGESTVAVRLEPAAPRVAAVTGASFSHSLIPSSPRGVTHAVATPTGTARLPRLARATAHLLRHASKACLPRPACDFAVAIRLSPAQSLRAPRSRVTCQRGSDPVRSRHSIPSPRVNHIRSIPRPRWVRPLFTRPLCTRPLLAWP